MIKIDVKFSDRFRKFFINRSDGWIKTFLEKFAELFLSEWKKNARSSRYWRLGFHSPQSPRAIPSKITQRTGRLIAPLYSSKNSREGISYSVTNKTNLRIVMGSQVPYAKYVYSKYQTLKKSLKDTMSKTKVIGQKAFKEIYK